MVIFQDGSNEFHPVVVNRSILQSMTRSEVYVLKWPKPLRYQFFRSLLLDVTITLCPSCNRVGTALNYYS